MIADIAGALPIDTAPEPGVSWDEAVLVLAIVGLAIVAVRKLWRLVAEARRSRSPKRWDGVGAYALGLVAGAVIGAAVVVAAGGTLALGLALGLGASVVGGRWLGRVEPGQVPRKPGHDEGV